MSNTVETKSFSALYPDYLDFKDNVWDPLLLLLSVGEDKLPPAYADESLMFYSPEVLFTYFKNKYDDFAALNRDERQHKLFINALADTLPALYAKTIMLNPASLALMTPEGLLTNIEKRFNDNADINYASTETAYSSTPSDAQASGTFGVENIKEKNIINRKDKTIRIKETSDLIAKLTELATVKISGYINEFINSIEFSSMWEWIDDDYPINVIYPKGEKGDTGEKGEKGDQGEKGDAGVEGKYPTLPGITTEDELYNAVDEDILYELTDPTDGHNVGLFTVYTKNEAMVVLVGVANDAGNARPSSISAIKNIQTMFHMVPINTETGIAVNDNETINLGQLTGFLQTKADKTTTTALQEDFDNLLIALEGQKVWDGDIDLPLNDSDNNIPFNDASLTTGLANLQPGVQIILKVQMGDVVQSVYLSESVDDNSFTSNKFFGDNGVSLRITTTNFEMNDLRVQSRGDYKLLEVRSQVPSPVVDVTNKADKDLNNVNVGVANAYKTLQVKADGPVHFVDYLSMFSGGVEQRIFANGKIETYVLGAKQPDIQLANNDLNNVNVGTANSGKLLSVKADGTLEYIKAPSGGGEIPKPLIINSGTINDNFNTLLDAMLRGELITLIEGGVAKSATIITNIFKPLLSASAIYTSASTNFKLDLTETLTSSKYFIVGQLYK